MLAALVLSGLVVGAVLVATLRWLQERDGFRIGIGTSMATLLVAGLVLAAAIVAVVQWVEALQALLLRLMAGLGA
jgi:hypothetical protein